MTNRSKFYLPKGVKVEWLFHKDDALKFRIIRVWRGCSPKEILWLNNVFDIHRNEKTIKLIKEKADGYDMDLKQKADSLMQKKLK